MNFNTIFSSVPSESEQRQLISDLGVFKIQGRDKGGRPILRILGKLFPGRLVSAAALKKFLDDEIFPSLAAAQFSVVYVHSGVSTSQNFPGILGLKSIFEAIPIQVMQNLAALYFLHPTFQSRFFLATFARLLFFGIGGLYCKLKYVDRLELLRKNVRWNELEMPEFVSDLEEEMDDDIRSAVDFGVEGDHPRFKVHEWTALSTYSTRCIA